MKTTKELFKVVAVSSNTGSFGHKNHVLLSRSGKAFDGWRQPKVNSGNPDLVPGDELEFEVDAKGNPVNWFTHHFEIISPSVHGDPPQAVYDEVWKTPKEKA